MFDGGIYDLDFPTEANNIKLWRVGRRLNEGGTLDLAHFRAYQSKNLLQFGAKIYYQTTANPGNEAENLIKNL